jgi:hypothetical protein
MMSSLADAVLLVALVTTSGIVAIMYAKLKRLDGYHAEYKRVFDQTAHALTAAQHAVNGFGRDGRDTLVALGERIEEARSLIAELDARGAAQARTAASLAPSSRS